ncbi:hypothetical protein [Plantibacter sp. YIM 135347]|uniref:hypothetical protein n=1 Tax=Plantibacter sp. YIM 135347 TaxID=3423919 RepID=UPI003D333BED
MELVGIGITATLTDDGVAYLPTSRAGRLALGSDSRTVPYADVVTLQYRERGVVTEGRVALQTERGRTDVSFRKGWRREAARFYVELCLRCPHVTSSALSIRYAGDTVERLAARSTELQAEYEALVAAQATAAARRKAAEPSSTSDRLLQLAALRNAGLISAEQFESALAAILDD